jgi:hypothetical protein
MDSRKHTLYPKSLLSPPRQYIGKYRKEPTLSPLRPYRYKEWWKGLDYVGRTLPDILSPVKKIFNMDD